MKLTKDNYFSRDADLAFMSNSQYSAFLTCEAAAFDQYVNGNRREDTTALLQGAYVDAWVEGTFDQFVEDHPEIISTRGATKGEVKAEFRQMDHLIKRFERDPLFVEYLQGDKQVIVTGNIGGVQYKGKIDVLHPERIVDLKTVRDFEPIWSAEEGRRISPVEFWGWHRQAAIYRELVYQTTGKYLPYFLAIVTKQTSPDIAILEIPKEVMYKEYRIIHYYSSLFNDVKTGKSEPIRCGRCDYCRETKLLEAPIDYRSLMEE